MPPFIRRLPDNAAAFGLSASIVFLVACGGSSTSTANHSDRAVRTSEDLACPVALLEAPTPTAFAFPPALRDKADAARRASELGVMVSERTTVYAWVLLDRGGNIAKVVPSDGSEQSALTDSITAFFEKMSFYPAEDAEGTTICVWLRLPLTLVPPREL